MIRFPFEYHLFIFVYFYSQTQPLRLVSEFWDQPPVSYWAHFVHATMLICQILDLDQTTQSGLVPGTWVSKFIYLLSSLYFHHHCTRDIYQRKCNNGNKHFIAVARCACLYTYATVRNILVIKINESP